MSTAVTQAVFFFSLYTIITVYYLQWHLEQYEECNCYSSAAVNSSECDSTTTVRHICQDEVLLDITLNSENLNSALSFQQNTTFYLISELL